MRFGTIDRKLASGSYAPGTTVDSLQTSRIARTAGQVANGTKATGGARGRRVSGDAARVHPHNGLVPFPGQPLK